MLFRSKKENITIETKSGIKNLKIILENNYVSNVVVDMGYPTINPKDIPVNVDDKRVINKKIIIDDKKYYINCISMGNPHTVIFVKNVDKVNLEKLYKKIHKSNIFEEKCNVEVVQILDKTTIKMRVYERGSGETLSCGTGACASVVAGVLNNLLDFDEEISVIIKGGTL